MTSAEKRQGNCGESSGAGPDESHVDRRNSIFSFRSEQGWLLRKVEKE